VNGFVESTTVEVIEHDALGRSLIDAGAAAHDDDAPGTIAHLARQLVNQGKVAEMIDEKLHFHAIPSLQRR